MPGSQRFRLRQSYARQVVLADIVRTVGALTRHSNCASENNPGCESCELVLKSHQVAKTTMNKNAKLSTEIEDPTAIPYFLWDEPMTIKQLKERLREASHPERIRLLGKILREARDSDVWKFTSPGEVLQLWPDLSLHLGRRRAFWEFLFKAWRREGLLA
jgi:hypothetical protein